jgi:exopolysaccharide biosynthesis WecB/TagA/CpsF family protein
MITTNVRAIGPIAIDVMTARLAVDRIVRAITDGEALTVTFCNAHSVNMARVDPEFAAAYRGTMTLNDGVGIDLASRLIHGEAFPENLNGTDLTPAVLEALPEPTPVFLLGSPPGVADRAGERIESIFPNARIVGTSDGFFEPDKSPKIAERIRQSRARLLLIAMGHPRQEKWAAAHRSEIDAVMICIGAYLDFVSGAVPRAPEWVRRIRFEWAYRLAIEPRRMLSRYLIGNVKFLTAALQEKMRGNALHHFVKSHD